MQSRPSVTYSSLQSIMATTVKRGLIRSQLGDRDHTTKINELLAHFADKASTLRGGLPREAIKSLGDLEHIIQFHEFTNAFNKIMQGPLGGKSSVRAAREVEAAINGSQQKWLANQWAPYFDLFSKDRHNSQRYHRWLNYKYYAFHLIKLINAILAPSSDFNLNAWLNQNLVQQDHALQVMNLEFNFIPRDETDSHYQIAQLIKNAANTNPEIQHTLQLAKLYGRYADVFLESKKIIRNHAHNEIDPQLRIFMRTLYRYIAENFNAFEEEHELYDDAVNHYFNAKRKLDKFIYDGDATGLVTLNPEFFNPERLRVLRELISEPSIKSEETWKIVQLNAYYLYFSTSDFIRFIDILKENDLSFITERILTLPLFKSQTLTAKEINEAMLKIESGPTQTPALFGDIITKELLTFVFGNYAINPSIPNDEMQLILCTLNNLSKHRVLIDNHRISYLFSPLSTSQLTPLKNLNQLLVQNKIADADAIKHICNYTLHGYYYKEFANRNHLISILIKLNEINLPVKNEGEVKRLISLCGFDKTTYAYSYALDSSNKLLTILDRYSNDCLALIMNVIYSPFDEEGRRIGYSDNLVNAFSEFSQYDESLKKIEILSPILSCRSNSHLILMLISHLLPFNTHAILDNMSNDDPNQPINLIHRMAAEHERLYDIFLGRGEQFFTNLMNFGIRYIPEGQKSYNLFNHIITLALNPNRTPENITRQIFRYLHDTFRIDDPFELPAEIEPPINQAQSTHTKSVHKSVSESAVRLRNYFHSNNIVYITHKSLDRLYLDISEAINNTDQSKKLYQILRLASKAVWRIKNESYGEFVDPMSGVMTRDLLAMIYECLFIEDVRTFTTPNGISHIVEEVDARNRLYQKLYEVANEYNLDENGNIISSKSAAYTCTPGCFNKVMEAGYTVINLIDILIITRDFALSQMKSMIQHEVINCIKAALEADKNEGKKLVADLVNGYPLSKKHYDQIFKKVKEAYSERFSSLYELDDNSIDTRKMDTEIEAGIQCIDYEELFKDYDRNTDTPSVTTVGLFSSAPESQPNPEDDQPKPTLT